MRTPRILSIVSVLCGILVPGVALAQGAIGGVVRDASGGVLPGVTVEVTSDALIEKARSVVSDDRGQYLIIDLRPGTYRMTFSLAGFRTVTREGLNLTAGVTLPINVELEVGAVEEAVTVTGETPVVDVSNTRQQTVLDRTVLDALPRSRVAMQTATLLPAVNAAASGTSITGYGTLAVHGGKVSDMTTSIDGLWIRDFSPSGGQNEMMPSDAGIQEFVFETSAISAETLSGGLRINIIPKEG